MPLPVSTRFQAAELADVNQPVAKVQIALGNYASASGYGSVASSSGDDPSGSYPAAGAIDDDRTEINVGAASGADNGVGLSSWRSNTIPAGGGTTWWAVNFNALRTVNRVKLYHLSGHGLKSYVLSYWDGSNWVPFASTADISLQGYGESPYGTGPYGGAAPTVPTQFTSTGTLDVIDFPDIATTGLRIDVNDTVVANDFANIVEFEVYRLIDISSRVISVEGDRSRDYKLGNNLSATVKLVVDNSDRFFSPSYTPTTAEAAAGYVNSELRPGLGLIVQHGFIFSYGGDSASGAGYGVGPFGAGPYGGESAGPTNGGGNIEYAASFTGTIDAINPDATARTVQIDGRDGMKDALNLSISTKLKTSQDIQACLQYVLNLCNISNYEQSLDVTSITEDYFFVFAETVQTVIQKLVQASGDAQFYFDESGIATFKMYLNVVPQLKTFANAGDYLTGTLTNVDVISNPRAMLREWFLIDDFTDGDITSNPAWTVDFTNGFLTPAIGSLSIGSINGTLNTLRAAFAQAYGTWDIQMSANIGLASASRLNFIINSVSGSGSGTLYVGYCLFKQGAHLTLGRFDAGNTFTTIASCGDVDGAQHDYRITRDLSGNFNVYVDGVLRGTGQDTTYTTSIGFGAQVSSTAGNSSNITIYSAYWSQAIDPTGTPSKAQAVWVSPVIDQGATILAEGTLQSDSVTDSSAPLSYYTATSADGVTFDPYVAATPGQIIPSSVKRYLKIKIILGSPQDDGLHNTYTNTPTVFNVSANWTTGAGSSKFHALPDFTISYSDVLLDLKQQIADTLGGDTAILNDVTVQSAPLILTGSDADVQWQGTTGTPAAAISGSNALVLGVGDHDFQCVVAGGMDTSHMSGANPAAAVVTGGATFTWSIVNIHPTQPVLRVSVTVAGTITGLQLVGKHFANSITPLQANSTDKQSIALYHRRSLPISNDFIINSGIAASIATRLISNYRLPVNYIPSAIFRPIFSMQLGDRIRLTDYITGINLADYTVIGLNRVLEVTDAEISRVQTEAVLIKIV